MVWLDLGAGNSQVATLDGVTHGDNGRMSVVPGIEQMLTQMDRGQARPQTSRVRVQAKGQGRRSSSKVKVQRKGLGRQQTIIKSGNKPRSENGECLEKTTIIQQ